MSVLLMFLLYNVLPVLRMTSCLHVMGVMLKATHQRAARFVNDFVSIIPFKYKWNTNIIVGSILAFLYYILTRHG